MKLAVGVRIGSYEVLGALGAGGMGEVYRARDVKLGREVALKVLPEALAADPDRLARFEREARMRASLNHPNIAQIYGFEESMLPAGPGAEIVRALVMELVEKRELHVIYLRELSEMKPVLADPRGRKVMAEMDAVLGKK